MTKSATDLNLAKSKAQLVFEYILLALCICVIAVRATFTESPTPQTSSQQFSFDSNTYTLAISGILIFLFIFWFIWNLFRLSFSYRTTAMEIGLCIFILAAVAACFTASDKRAAITSSITLLAPVFMAVLLVQILDSHSKIKLLLIVIAALGVVSAYECKEQFSYWNEQQIEFYQQNSNTILAQQNITPGSLKHWLFEHRLYSKDVHGFFTTGNSAGSFALLASFAAVALFIRKLPNISSPKKRKSILPLLFCAIATVIVFFGLAVTKSKGAIAASLIAAIMLIIYLCLGNWLKNHKKTVLTICLLLTVVVSGLAVLYGLAHNRLPGGNSMLVRWQYWLASARMYADYSLTGVGPGNFVYFFPHYKPPSALETVSDPHNVILSIITQYGPLGLVGFLALVSVPLWKTVFSDGLPSHRPSQPEQGFGVLSVIFLIVISIALLLIRPIVLKIPATASPGERQAAEVIFYVMPVLVFIVGFLLLMPSLRAIRNTSITTAVLFCAIVGFLIHNLIDFAIFEPGVSSVFWAMMACLIATDSCRKSRPPVLLKPALLTRALAIIISVIVIWAYFYYALMPVTRTSAKTRQAIHTPAYAHELLEQASEKDPLNPNVSSLNGRFYLQHYNDKNEKQPFLLKRAAECFLNAINRNKADFRNFEYLAKTYTRLAEASLSDSEKNRWLNKALDNFYDAVERYPGSGQLRFELARIAEQTGKTDIAVKHYSKAVKIEDEYRGQFRIMYPGRKIFSRLGEEKYNHAHQRIKLLSAQPIP